MFLLQRAVEFFDARVGEFFGVEVGELIDAKMAQVGELIGVRQMSQKLVDTPTTACWGRGPGDPGKSQDVGTLQVEAAARTADMSTDFRAEMRHAVRQMK